MKENNVFKYQEIPKEKSNYKIQICIYIEKYLEKYYIQYILGIMEIIQKIDMFNLHVWCFNFDKLNKK